MSAQLHELAHEECLRLLGQGGVGRLAFASPTGIQVILVDYQLHEDAVVFRTTPYSQLGLHGPGQEAALEIDELDPVHHTAWSVVAKGTMHVVSKQAEVVRIKRDHDPEPWAEGVRQLYVKLVWRELTGRWIGAEHPTPAPAPVVGGRQIALAPDVAGTPHARRTGQPPRW